MIQMECRLDWQLGEDLMTWSAVVHIRPLLEDKRYIITAWSEHQPFNLVSC